MMFPVELGPNRGNDRIELLRPAKVRFRQFAGGRAMAGAFQPVDGGLADRGCRMLAAGALRENVCRAAVQFDRARLGSDRMSAFFFRYSEVEVRSRRVRPIMLQRMVLGGLELMFHVLRHMKRQLPLRDRKRMRVPLDVFEQLRLDLVEPLGSLVRRRFGERSGQRAFFLSVFLS
jgi:hypothetical protein